MKREFLLKKRGKVWYYRLAHEITFHSTGKRTKVEAQKFVVDLLKNEQDTKVRKKHVSLRQFTRDYFIWDKCPHQRRLIEEGKTIGINIQ